MCATAFLLLCFDALRRITMRIDRGIHLTGSFLNRSQTTSTTNAKLPTLLSRTWSQRRTASRAKRAIAAPVCDARRAINAQTAEQSRAATQRRIDRYRIYRTTSCSADSTFSLWCASMSSLIIRVLFATASLDVARKRTQQQRHEPCVECSKSHGN